MKFSPRDFVTITLLGLNYKGRVQRCIKQDGPEWLFEVQYANDTGELKIGEFYADELRTNENG